jgi:hypothetical protein
MKRAAGRWQVIGERAMIVLALLGWILGYTAFAGPPRPPALLIGTGEAKQRVELHLEHPLPILPGWTRFDARPAGGLVAQAFVSATHMLVDVFNVSSSPIYVEFAGVASDGLEYAREVPPWCGIAWSSDPPTRATAAPPTSTWDPKYSLTSWAKTDVAWTMTTGSPRNRFFSEHRWRAARGGVSRAMEEWFDRYVRWQLQRSYQQPEAQRAFPRVLLGQSAVGGKATPYPGIGTVLPGDTHHWTVGLLADAFLLTGDPRAFDQLTRAMSWALATQDYYRVDWPYPYGGSERVPGWLLVSLADAGEAFDAAGYASLVEWCRLHATAHVERLETIGFNESGLPNIVSAPDPGRHLSVPWNSPWQGAIVGFGLQRVHEVLGVPGAHELGLRWVDYVETRGWNGMNVVYDSIPHHPEHQHVAPRVAGVPGLGLWSAPALILAGRVDSPLVQFLIARSTATKVSGQPLFSPSHGLSYFAPLF